MQEDRLKWSQYWLIEEIQKKKRGEIPLRVYERQGVKNMENK